MTIEGLTYIEKAVPDELVLRIHEWFYSDQTQSEMVPITSSANSRRVLHYGYKYNYTSGSIHEETDAMPEIVKELLGCVPSELSGYFNQCIINRYSPGQGISAHVDRREYGDTIGCFTFGLTGRVMKFSRRGQKSVELYTSPGSLYIMEGDARYKWKHSMPARYYDIRNDVKETRKSCFSITFRNVPAKLKVNKVN